MRHLLIGTSLLCGALHAAEVEPGIVVEAPPGTRITDQFVAVYPNGFVARQGDILLMGDALRHDLRNQLLYAEGRVVLVLPPLRVHAERLGLDATAQRGEAWGIQAWVETPNGVIPIAADHLTLNREEIVFTGLRSRRHGGVFGIGADRLRIRLRPQPLPDRSPPANFVKDITLNDVRLSAFGIPFFWLPVIFRDYTFEYPWTQFRFGSSSRLGAYGIYRIATSFPEIAGLRTRAELRVDAYSRAGKGIGTDLEWRQPVLGRGHFLWFGVDESVFPLERDGGALIERWNRVIDVDHRAQIPGGAVALRYTDLPRRDPLDTISGDQAPAERFRYDYLRDDLNHKSFARQGAAVAWGGPVGAVVLDTERRPSQDINGVDRVVGLEAALTSVQILGPVHADGVTWFERLDDPAAEHRAWRLQADTALRGLVWLGGLGVDASVGGRGLLYDDRTLAGVEVDGSRSAAYPYAAAGVRVRLESLHEGWRHSLTPRVGVDFAGTRSGDDLSAEGFAQARDRLEDDHRWVVTGIETAIWRGREWFRASGEVRFAIREADRERVDENGQTLRSQDHVVGIRLRATGRPLTSLTVFTDVDWDARGQTWQAFDTGIRWQPLAAFALRYDGSYNPIPDIDDPWEHRPGVEIIGNRYRLDAKLSLRPQGAAVDGWGLTIQREAVDGTFGVTYEQFRDGDGNLRDTRLGVILSLH